MPNAICPEPFVIMCLCDGICVVVSVVEATVPLILALAVDEETPLYALATLPVMLATAWFPTVTETVWPCVSLPPLAPFAFDALAPTGTRSRRSGVPSVPSQICQLVFASPLMSGYFPVASSSPNHILISPGLHGVGTSTHALSLPDASAFGTAPAAGVAVKEGSGKEDV